MEMNNLWRYFTIGRGNLECLNGTPSRVSHGFIVGESGGNQSRINLNQENWNFLNKGIRCGEYINPARCQLMALGKSN